MKIVFFDFSPLTFDGGFEKNITNLAMFFAKKHDVKIMTGNQFMNNVLCLMLHGHKFEKRITNQYVLKKINKIKHFVINTENLFPFTKSYSNYKKILSDSDIVYTKNEIPDILLLKYFLLFKNKPIIVCGVHTPIKYTNSKSLTTKLHNFIYTSVFYKWVIKDVKIRFLTLTNTERNFVNKTLNISRKNIQIIPNGLDIDKYKPYKKRLNPNYVSILFAGRMTEQKGVDIVEKTINLLSKKENFKKMEFVFAGKGELETIPKKLSKTYSNVKYLGHVTDMTSVYKKTDIAIAPSRWEGHPYICLEAQSCGIPMIVTNISGSKDIVINNKTGFVISNNTLLEKALIKMVDKYFYDKKKYNSFSNNARNNILKNFSKQTISTNIENYFQKLVS